MGEDKQETLFLSPFLHHDLSNLSLLGKRFILDCEGVYYPDLVEHIAAEFNPQGKEGKLVTKMG